VPLLSDRLHAHLPWQRNTEFLGYILDLGLAPEIAFKGPDLDDLAVERLVAVGRLIRATGQRPTVHAPFFDLSPGAIEPLVREVTRQRLTQSLQAAAHLGAHLMVVHPGYDRWRYPNLAATWTDHAATTFAPLVVMAEQCDCRLALENIYEQSPVTLLDLAARLDSPWFGHCFDIGHWQLFGRTSLSDWLTAIGPRLLHLHLHDNHGQSDDHLPVGEGSIDYAPLMKMLSCAPQQPSVTLEAHNPEELRRSLANLNQLMNKELSP
jgi:sugar phosphate isomerase/epimerase